MTPFSQSLIAIDPGYAKAGQGCACSYFERAVLVHTWFARPLPARSAKADFPLAPGESADLIILEEVQADARTWGSDLRIALRLQAEGCLLAGIYAGLCGATTEIALRKPTDWKGSVPKPVQHMALWKVLGLDERALLGGAQTERRIEAALDKGAGERWKRKGAMYYGSWQGHNVLDSVALGATELGRLGR